MLGKNIGDIKWQLFKEKTTAFRTFSSICNHFFALQNLQEFVDTLPTSGIDG